MADCEDLFIVFDKSNVVDDDDKVSNAKEKKKRDDFMKVILDAEQDLNEGEAPKKKAKVDILHDIEQESLEESSRIKIHTVETIEACTHEVCYPPNMEFVPLKLSQHKPAKEYPFILDPFQKEAILCLENNQSVLVSAHTSAGKTVVATYAIAMSFRSKQRVIYTTPIKALSNQKYREFSDEFSDVGLITGDVTINATASCLIMTTEILRSMLYRGSEVMREVGWVIFDEIHYMRDKERGVVWEETLILLPDNVHFVFLSATIPNALQFAQWICHLHHQPCHVVYTEFRPVPLQQYIFPAGGDGLFMVVNEHGNFLNENFDKAMESLQLINDNGPTGGRRQNSGGKGGDSSCHRVVKMIMERNFSPVIVFSFSKRECEAHATQMKHLHFNTDEEQELVEEVFNNAMDVLSEEDRQLDQVVCVLPLLKNGIGIHHSGLLPILKETIEVLFGEGLIKALFATETFAMGLNMPARTVLFTGARKFDGKDFRWLTSGEYVQMSGRAGRRGLDDQGIVILMLDEKMSPTDAKKVVMGLPDPINSAFHLTYNMVLNLLRVDEINPEYMMERSFFQFQNYSAIPELMEKIEKLKKEYESYSIPNEDEVSSYFKIKQQLETLDDEMYAYVVKPEFCLGVLKSGRLVKVRKKESDFGWAMVVNVEQTTVRSDNSRQSATVYVVQLLLHVSQEGADSNLISDLRPPEGDEIGVMKVVPVKLDLIHEMSAVRLYPPTNLVPLENRMKVIDMMKEVKKQYPDGLPLIDPVEDLHIKDKELKYILDKITAFKTRLNEHPLKNDADIENLLDLYKKKLEVETKLKEVRSALKKAKSLLQMEDLKCRKRVLRRLGFSTSSDVIEIKGRVACEISSADELLLTELIFSGIFNDLDVHQTTALLSCFVFQEKSNNMPSLTEELSGPLRIMQDTARRIAKVSKECKLPIEPDLYVESFKPHIMDIIYVWSKGGSFADICKMSDIFEGSIIRCLRLLEELLRQLCQAGKAIGNKELENKFAEAIKCIKRDIAFAASLYL